MGEHTLTTEALTDSLARYVLAIYELAMEHKVARSKDIAELVGVSRPSVTGALQKLDRAGFIEYEPYGYVTLTARGEGQARQLLLKHRATQDFLELALGLPRERAEAVAGQIEQSLPADVLCRLVQFNNFYRSNPDKRYEWDPTCRNLCQILYGVQGPRTCHDEHGHILPTELPHEHPPQEESAQGAAGVATGGAATSRDAGTSSPVAVSVDRIVGVNG